MKSSQKQESQNQHLPQLKLKSSLLNRKPKKPKPSLNPPLPFQLLNHRKTRRLKEKIIKKQRNLKKTGLKDATTISGTYGVCLRALQLLMNVSCALN